MQTATQHEPDLEYSGYSRSSALLAALLPAGVGTAELTGQGNPASLQAAERLLLGRCAPVRQREFAAGRLCARRAAAQLGVADAPMGTGDDRRPLWPRTLTGSITHTDGFAAAVVGQRRQFRALGIDAERVGCLSAELFDQVLLPTEMDWLRRLPASDRAKGATLIFSAKEAFYKCQYEVTEQWLEFQDVVLELLDGTLNQGRVGVRAVGRVKLFEHGGGAEATVRFVCAGDLVLTAMVIATH